MFANDPDLKRLRIETELRASATHKSRVINVKYTGPYEFWTYVFFIYRRIGGLSNAHKRFSLFRAGENDISRHLLWIIVTFRRWWGGILMGIFYPPPFSWSSSSQARGFRITLFLTKRPRGQPAGLKRHLLYRRLRRIRRPCEYSCARPASWRDTTTRVTVLLPRCAIAEIIQLLYYALPSDTFAKM